MARHDVVVTTPQCVSPAYRRVVLPPPDFFDLVIIDEAHHEPAKTWRSLVEHFPKTRRLLLTATPFRRDRRGLSGEIVYWYSLHDAMADHVYAPIHFRAVHPKDGESEDDAVARVAIARMNSPEHLKAGSQLVVRTDEIDDALRLRELYSRNGLELSVLSSNSSQQEVDRILTALEKGASRGAAVVGVPTEGFDLPRLKIAAYHKKHKSLAATLQFIGRIARVVSDAPPPELLAIPEVISGETRHLYDEDSSWTELLPRIADTAVYRERERREYSQSFPQPQGNYSRASIFPPKRIQCYRISSNEALADVRLTSEWPSQLVRSAVYDYATDSDGSLALIITRDVVHPPWLLSDALDSYEYTLHLACIDRERGYFYLTTSSDASRRELLRHFSFENNTTEVAPERLNAVLHAVGIEGYSNIGIRMSREAAAQGLSYHILTGRDPTHGIGAMDVAGSSAGHLIGRYKEGEELRSISVSLDSGRIRESGDATLLDYRDWCYTISQHLEITQSTNTPPGLALPVRASFSHYPNDAVGVALPAPFYSGEIELEVDDRWENAFSLESRVRSAGACLLMGFYSGKRRIATVAYDQNGRVTARVDAIARYAMKTSPIADLLSDLPRPQFYFADGSTVVGNGLLSRRPYHAALRSDLFELWDWQSVDIRREALAARPAFQKNVQQRAIEEFASRNPEAYIVVDDGAGEIADIIVLRFRNQRILDISLVHCKWSVDDVPGRRLIDLYQVTCQAMRSTRWASPRLLLPELSARVRSRTLTHCVQGTADDLLHAIEQFGNRGIYTTSIFAVQPGISNAALPRWEEGRNLASACDDFISRANVALTFCISA